MNHIISFKSNATLFPQLLDVTILIHLLLESGTKYICLQCYCFIHWDIFYLPLVEFLCFYKGDGARYNLSLEAQNDYQR